MSGGNSHATTTEEPKAPEKKVIDKLTPEQEVQLEVYYKRWLAVGLQTGPREHEKIEAALRKVYECGGCKPPQEFIWGCSPLATAKLVDEAAGKSAGGSSSACYGTHDASWLGFYSYMREVLGLVEETQELIGLMEAAEAGASWFWPFENICFVSELPSEIHMDEQGRLHCPTGPALSYGNDLEVYAWHDTLVPEDVIKAPEKLTAERINKEPNAEIRRVLLERFGQDRFIVDSGLKPVHEDETGQLFKAELEGDEPLAMIRVVDATSKKPYWLRVPPTMKTAKEAVAWTFNLKPEDYHPIQES